MAREDSIARLVDRLELPFNSLGVDPYGISKWHLRVFFHTLGFLYRTYFRVQAFGVENVPDRGRAMLIGNHSGGVAIDGMMVIASMLLEKEPPRLAQGMAEKFLAGLPVASLWSSRTGQFTGLPEHAIRLLEDDRLLLVFPEGARGTAKLYKDRYSLVDFGTGFMRMALKTKTPIVPVGVVGAEEQSPALWHVRSVAKVLGIPYLPVTPTGVPFPLPTKYRIYFGEPMTFTGTADEDDQELEKKVQSVRDRIQGMLDVGVKERQHVFW